jgi:hypothetical protein
MKMKKVYQIKESEIFKIINNLISEENQSNHTVYASGTIGQSPKYDGLKALFKKFKQAVEAELRSGIPYCVVNGSTKVERGSGANEIMLKVTLEPCKEEEKHSFFDLAGAIYSYDYSQNSSNTRAAVFRALGDKAKMFTGTKEGGVRILKTNTVGLVGIKDIDPKNPEKQYTLHIGYVVGIKADDYSELGPLETPGETRTGEEPQPSGENPRNQKSAETVTAAAAATKVTEPNKSQEPTSKSNLNEIIKDEWSVTADLSTSTGCDLLHAFESSGGVKGGEMHKKVGEKLDELYKKGYNPIVTKVDVTVSGNTVSWSCTINESTDGKAWVGFTSRGAGCGSRDFLTRAEEGGTVGNDVDTMTKRIKDVYKEKDIEVKQVNDFVYDVKKGAIMAKYDSAGNKIKTGTAFRQIFYAYTKPGKYPANK